MSMQSMLSRPISPEYEGLADLVGYEAGQLAEYESRTIDYINPSIEESALAEQILEQIGHEEPVVELRKLMDQFGDQYTRQHCDRTAQAAVIIGYRLGLAEEDLLLLARAGVVHDVGKESAALQPLVQSTRYFEEDRDESMAVLDQHSELGAQIIANSSWDDVTKQNIMNLVKAHHAYSNLHPHGEVPKDPKMAYLAQILAASDMVDAYASQRPYKTACSLTETENILRLEFAGNHNIIEVIFPRSIKQDAKHLGHLAAAS